jgi:DNA polymerase IIIc chi subunit
MTEILFYHLHGQKLEGVLPPLLEKSLDRGWKVAVQATSEERIDALDAYLWTYRDDGFLPHGTWREPEANQQPVLLTPNEGNPNGATVRFLIDRAPIRKTTSGLFSCSTVRMKKRSRRPVCNGPKQKRGVLRRPIGKPTSAGVGPKKLEQAEALA